NRAAARGLEGFAVLGEVQVADLQLAVGNAIQRFLVAEGDGSARLAGNHAVHVVATRSTAKHHANAARCLVNYTGAGADKREVRDERDGERVGVAAVGAARAVAAVVLDGLRVGRRRAGDCAGNDAARLVGDQVLQASAVALGHVEVIVTGFVGNEVACVHHATEPLVVVVQAGHRLQVFQGRTTADGSKGEAVELCVRRSGES